MDDADKSECAARDSADGEVVELSSDSESQQVVASRRAATKRKMIVESGTSDEASGSDPESDSSKHKNKGKKSVRKGVRGSGITSASREGDHKDKPTGKAQSKSIKSKKAGKGGGTSDDTSDDDGDSSGEKTEKEQQERSAEVDFDVFDADIDEESLESDSSDSDDESDDGDDSDESDDSDDGDDGVKPKSSVSRFAGSEVRYTEDLNRMRLSRFRIAKLVHYPCFAQVVVGCFVRVSVECNKYVAAEVIGVSEVPGKYMVEDTYTNKMITLRHSGHKEVTMKLKYVSNSHFTDEEYVNWHWHMEQENLPFPTLDFVAKKEADIFAACNHTYTDEEVNVMLREKERFNELKKTTAFEKRQLGYEKQAAEDKGDLVTALNIEKKIRDLSEKSSDVAMKSFAVLPPSTTSRRATVRTVAVKDEFASLEYSPFQRLRGHSTVKLKHETLKAMKKANDAGSSTSKTPMPGTSKPINAADGDRPASGGPSVAADKGASL